MPPGPGPWPGPGTCHRSGRPAGTQAREREAPEKARAGRPSGLPHLKVNIHRCYHAAGLPTRPESIGRRRVPCRAKAERGEVGGGRKRREVFICLGKSPAKRNTTTQRGRHPHYEHDVLIGRVSGGTCTASRSAAEQAKQRPSLVRLGLEKSVFCRQQAATPPCQEGVVGPRDASPAECGSGSIV